jgi:fungal STAND N-terminal Goodbye domain
MYSVFFAVGPGLTILRQGHLHQCPAWEFHSIAPSTQIYLFPVSSAYQHPGHTESKQSVIFMSSTRQVTPSTSDIQLIIDAALADYAKITGIDLSKSSFTAILEQSNSPEAILVLLQERQKAFKTYRDRNRRLISCLSPAVTIIHAFSGILGEAISLVSVTYQPPCEYFNVVASDPLLTSKSCVREYRCSPRCTSLRHAFQSGPL